MVGTPVAASTAAEGTQQSPGNDFITESFKKSISEVLDLCRTSITSAWREVVESLSQAKLSVSARENRLAEGVAVGAAHQELETQRKLVRDRYV